jgi:hypothetical protein
MGRLLFDEAADDPGLLGSGHGGPAIVPREDRIKQVMVEQTDERIMIYVERRNGWLAPCGGRRTHASFSIFQDAKN